jgi:hypothetical protein
VDQSVVMTVGTIALAALVLLAFLDARPPHDPRRDRDPERPPDS